MQVTIAFAAPSGPWRQQLQVPAGTTVGEALSLSAFAREFPEFTDHLPVLGVYGERCEPSRVLHEADRVELYRPLVFDPQESRRRRAVHRKSRAGHARGDG
ncbi:RnfH family protein [Castellaniella sp. UC4442_H9]